MLIRDIPRCYGCQSKRIVQVMSLRAMHRSAQCLLFGSHTAVSAWLQQHMELKKDIRLTDGKLLEAHLNDAV